MEEQQGKLMIDADAVVERVVLPAAKKSTTKQAADAFRRPKPLRLSSPEAKPLIDAVKKRNKEDPEFRKRLLQRAGILTATGKLSKSFGG